MLKYNKDFDYKDYILKEYEDAVINYHIALDNFNNAKGEYIEVSILLLQAAELTLEAFSKKLKIYENENEGFSNKNIPVELPVSDRIADYL